MKIKKTPTWQNTIKKYTSHPVRYFYPENLADIVSIVNEAEANAVKIKAVGSGHSFSDIAVTNDYFVDLEKLDEVKELDLSFIKSSFHDKPMIEAQAGITLHNLNLKLDTFNMALINMGGIDHQTLAGVIATATHGTGKSLSSIPGFVRSMTIVISGGKLIRLEPSDGITDPLLYSNNSIELIQDDDIFYSALVSFGCFGIIYSCVIDVLDQYYLRETKIKTNWIELKKIFRDGTVFTEGDVESEGKCPRCCSFVINPYEVNGDNHYCIVMRHYETQKPRKWKLIEGTRNLISQILGNIPYFFFYTYWLFRVFPHRSPKLIRGSLKGMRDKKFVHRSHKVLYQGFEFVKERAYDAEFAFNLADAENIIRTVEELMEKAKEIKETHKVYQSSPIGIRFVNRSKAFLAPEYNKEVAYIDTPFLIGINGNEFMLDKYQQIMFRNGGIPHWGKCNSILDEDPSKLEDLYPRLNTWKKTMHHFDPMGTFSSSFSERLKLTTGKSQKKEIRRVGKVITIK